MHHATVLCDVHMHVESYNLATYSPLRTGRRTFGGLLKDGFNSAVRYYYNNFNDGYRQVILMHTYTYMYILSNGVST